MTESFCGHFTYCEEIKHIKKRGWLIVIFKNISLCSDEGRQADGDEKGQGTHIRQRYSYDHCKDQ